MSYRNYRKRRYNNKYKPKPHKCPIPKFGSVDRYVANKALWMGKKALSMLNVEYKCIDKEVNAASLSSTPRFDQLTNIQQGSTAVTRDGNQIKLTQCYLQYHYTIHASATDTTVRVMLVQDRQTNGAIFAIGDLLEQTSGLRAIMSPLVIDNKFRFKILYNKVHTLSADGSSSAVYRKKVIPLNLKVRYDANDGLISDLTSESLALVSISNEATNTPSMNAYIRLRFVDN